MPRKFYPGFTIFTFLFFHTSVFSQTFSLLKDINAGSSGSSFFNFTNVNGTLFFRPDDGVHGDELWKSNGTSAGTVLVKDINPGSTGSDLQEFVNLNGVLYFRADDGVHGSELWKSDGTAAGTVMVKDIFPGFNSGVLSSFFAASGVLYFQADDGVHGTELWKSDGTAAGTILLKDIYQGAFAEGINAGVPRSGNPNNFTLVNGAVYFAASGGVETHEVWKTDGTIAGTVMVKDIYSGVMGYALNNFVNLNGTLILTVYGGASGSELWKSDGTAAGTTLIKAMPGGNFSNHPTVMNNVLYFLEGDGLWKSDATPGGTILLKQKGGTFSLSPELMIAINNKLFFTGNDDENGLELWTSDGTAAGTVLVKDINPGINNSELNAFTKVGTKLMFTADNGVNGNEVWSSDGTAAGTQIFQDIEPGAGSSMPVQIFEVKGAIAEANGKIFTGASTTAFGNEVWIANAPAEAALPVELLEFKGTLVGVNAYLQWKTEHEINTSVFIVERSTDGNNYYQKGTILAANGAGINQYSFTDPDIVSLGVSIVYYRLRLVDLDGNYKYSGIVPISLENKKLTVQLYPNPVSNQINLKITSYESQKIQWRLSDNAGRLIKGGHYTISRGINFITEDASLLSSGLYYLQLFNGLELQQSIKVVKQ